MVSTATGILGRWWVLLHAIDQKTHSVPLAKHANLGLKDIMDMGHDICVYFAGLSLVKHHIC